MLRATRNFLQVYLTIFKTIPSSSSGACPVPTRNNFKRSTAPGFGLVCKQRRTSGGSAGWRSHIPPGPGREVLSSLQLFGQTILPYFLSSLFCAIAVSLISSAHLCIQHCNRTQDSFSKWGWRGVRCGSNPYRELPEQTPNPTVPRAAQSGGTEPPLGPHCSRPR